MAAFASERRELWTVVAISATIGSVAGLAVAGDPARGLLQGGLSGVLVSLAARATGRLLERSGLHRLRFGVYLAVSALATALAIVAAIAAAAVPWALTTGIGSLGTYVVPFAVACAAAVAFTVWFSLDRLLGGDVLVGLLTGRYHRPRIEERVFLLADLADSTRLAERLGELRFHEFLNRLWADLAVPVQRHGGTVVRYIGDEIEITWTVERARRNADCLRCARAILEAVSAAASEYGREFGTAPRLRLALHGGPVVAGEVGALKREIAYSGDTLNTTARIEAVAKELDRELVISADLLDAIVLPPGLVAEPLGLRRLRGKERSVALFAIEGERAGYGARMAAKRILVVAAASPEEAGVRERLRDQIPDGAEVRVVAPATKVSALDWLTNAEDDARGDAAEVAERTADALEGAARVEVDRTSQNMDAAEDVRDALRLFEPDEIVVVASASGDDTWLEEEAVREALAAPGVPVRRVEA